MDARYLKCKVSDGMFSDERVIELSVPQRGNIAFIVPAHTIHRTSSAVSVQIIQKDNQHLAIIPSQRRPAVPVHSSDLLPA